MTHSVSLVGVGVLGKAISLRLLQRQFSLSVFNRTHSKASEVGAEGAQAVAELHQLFTQEKQVVLICLKDAEAIRDVFQSEAVIQKLTRYRPLLLNISTIGPEESRWMEAFFFTNTARIMWNARCRAGRRARGRASLPPGWGRVWMILPAQLTMSSPVCRIAMCG
nr:NAD(P)-binding domain-containing protein [Pectobacterium colocasium]